MWHNDYYPQGRQTALIELVEEPSKISFHQIGKLDDYVKRNYGNPTYNRGN